MSLVRKCDSCGKQSQNNEHEGWIQLSFPKLNQEADSLEYMDEFLKRYNMEFMGPRPSRYSRDTYEFCTVECLISAALLQRTVEKSANDFGFNS